MVKFLLSGNGFLDPYSTYLQFTVETTLAANEVKTLDRSAHSFIQRMVIRSQGVELERIENYDVVAAMINDMIYSPE
jgi:starvation-inducible outer membrane lipoprotein